VTGKDVRIAAAIARFQGRELEAHYLGYFGCFNRQLFYEAHEVLEPLWLAQRRGPKGAFYKGLIQLAGAFVHLAKNRPRPAAALFRLAGANLGQYPGTHDLLDVQAARLMIQEWVSKLEAAAFTINPLDAATPPQLHLQAHDETLRCPINAAFRT
jgi:predicted metal-dependent hydrolase